MSLEIEPAEQVERPGSYNSFKESNPELDDSDVLALFEGACVAYMRYAKSLRPPEPILEQNPWGNNIRRVR